MIIRHYRWKVGTFSNDSLGKIDVIFVLIDEEMITRNTLYSSLSSSKNSEIYMIGTFMKELEFY